MKVLYIGVYRDGTGYGNAAIEHILALDKAGVDVVPRCLKLNNNQVELPYRLIELEQKSTDGCDIAIQHCLPHQMSYHGGYKNIALFANETDSLGITSWDQKLNMMDEIWVINPTMESACRKSGVNIPIKVVPHPTDIERFKKSYQPFEIEALQGKFVFYFVGEFVKRKNIVALLKAFHSEFDIYENVALLLKTHIPNMPPQEAASKIQQFCQETKKCLKKHSDESKYISEVIVTDTLSQSDIMKLHKTGHCLVIPSYGEAWCLPIIDAMGIGNAVIANDCGGMSQIVDNEDFLVRNRLEPCFGAIDTFNDLYTSYENWWNIDIIDLRNKMRHIFENNVERVKIGQKNMKRVYDFSYDKIGNLMKGYLCESS